MSESPDIPAEAQVSGEGEQKVRRWPQTDYRAGERVEWRGHRWLVADVRDDDSHVHLTLTAPEKVPYRPSTNDG